MTAYLSFEVIETDRLRAHFEWVLAVLRAQDTSALSAEARARREATLAELEAYADRGVFPHNIVSDEMTPAFIDDRGVTCAVAELMVRSGAGELAGRVRACAEPPTRNDSGAMTRRHRRRMSVHAWVVPEANPLRGWPLVSEESRPTPWLPRSVTMRDMSAENIFVDRLFEKHECGPEPVEEEGARQVLVEGAAVHVLFPKYVPAVEVVSASKQGDLLFLVGRIQAPPEWGVAGNGAVLVARRMRDDVYGVHVWHELHRGTLEHLVEGRSDKGEAR